jgi:hypothetical protein
MKVGFKRLRGFWLQYSSFAALQHESIISPKLQIASPFCCVATKIWARPHHVRAAHPKNFTRPPIPGLSGPGGEREPPLAA